MEGADRVAGELFRLARVKAGLTQAELADRAGVSQLLISAYEGGHRQPMVPTLMRLLGAAGLELRMGLEPAVSQFPAADVPRRRNADIVPSRHRYDLGQLTSRRR